MTDVFITIDYSNNAEWKIAMVYMAQQRVIQT